MRNNETSELSKRITDLFTEYNDELDIEGFIKSLEKDMAVFDIRLDVHVPAPENGPNATVAYACFFTIQNDAVVTVYTFPGCTTQWYCKY